jgi:hypothetical protein
MTAHADGAAPEHRKRNKLRPENRINGMDMSDALRRIYNSIDLLFDTRAISQEMRFSRAGAGSRLPKTALQVFNEIQPIAKDLDRDARLKMIVSQLGVDLDGTSSHWEFFFDLTQRRAQMVCEWVLPWDQDMDGYEPASIEIVVRPFPAPNSLIRKAVREGKLLHRQMVGMWKQEYKRRPDLPHKFRDSGIAMADFLQQGLDPAQFEFSLSTGQSPQGLLRWIAQTRHDTYSSSFV